MSNNLYRALSLIIFVLLWEGIASALSRPYILPTPVSVAVAFKELLISSGPPGFEWAGELVGNTLISLLRVLGGFCIAGILAISLGIAMGWWRPVRGLLQPIIEIMRPIPPLAWIPLAMLWFGLGTKPAIFLIALGGFFPIVSNTILGLESTSKTLLEIAKTLGAKERHLLMQVVIPSATPSIMAGLKIALGACWMCLVAAELTGSNSGLGFMIMYYHGTMEPAKTIVGMLTIGLIGVLLFIALQKFENKLLFWRESI